MDVVALVDTAGQPQPEPEPEQQRQQPPPRPSQPPPLPQPSSPSQREPDLSAAHVSRLFQAADRNSDGRITRAELIKACRADAHFRSVLGLPERIQEDQRDRLESVFQGMDTDDSRGVDEAEFAAFLQRKFAPVPPSPSSESFLFQQLGL